MKRRGFLKALMGAVASVVIMRAQLVEHVIEPVREKALELSLEGFDSALKEFYGGPTYTLLSPKDYCEAHPFLNMFEKKSFGETGTSFLCRKSR